MGWLTHHKPILSIVFPTLFPQIDSNDQPFARRSYCDWHLEVHLLFWILTLASNPLVSFFRDNSDFVSVVDRVWTLAGRDHARPTGKHKTREYLRIFFVKFAPVIRVVLVHPLSPESIHQRQQQDS